MSVDLFARNLASSASGQIADINDKVDDVAVYVDETADTDVSYDLDNNTVLKCTSSAGVSTILLDTSDVALEPQGFSEIIFKSGSTPTVITQTGSEDVRLVGTDCQDGETLTTFSPVANKIYDIMIFSDGFGLIGYVLGYSG